MIQVSTLVPQALSIAPANAVPSEGGPGFSLAFALAGADAAATPPPDIAPPALPADAVPEERQPIAGTGSDLPVDADPQLAWIDNLHPAAAASSPAAAPDALAPAAAYDLATASTIVEGRQTALLIARAPQPATRQPVANDAIALEEVAPLAPPPKHARDEDVEERTKADDLQDDAQPVPTASVIVPPIVFTASPPVALPVATNDRATIGATPGSAVIAAPVSIATPAPAIAAPGLPAAPQPGIAADIVTVPAAVTIQASADPQPTPSFTLLSAARPETPIKIDIGTGAPAAASPEASPAAVAAAPTPAVEGPLIGVPQPAARAFAAAIVAASRPVRAARDHGEGPVAGLAAGASLASITAPSAIAAPGAVDNSPLDTRREDWAQRLIDRIDSLRDAADSNDARIRLIPAGLGKIDVALRQQGDVLHVHFNAEVPATRALLADAQPRLAELAAERGLRLGQSGVDGGAQGQGDRRPPAAQAAFAPSAPPRARENAHDDDTGSDRRIG